MWRPEVVDSREDSPLKMREAERGETETMQEGSDLPGGRDLAASSGRIRGTAATAGRASRQARRKSVRTRTFELRKARIGAAAEGGEDQGLCSRSPLKTPLLLFRAAAEFGATVGGGGEMLKASPSETARS
jgi:hypothetical protein